jgi:hypothetical protein
MKGYLERMAMNTVRPQGGIHPLVGSIYARPTTGAPSDSAEEPVLLEEERVIARPQPVRAAKHAAGEPDVLRKRARAKSEVTQRTGVAESSRREAPRTDASRASFRPLLGRRGVASAGDPEYGTAADTERGERSERSELLRPQGLKFAPLLPHEPPSSFGSAAGQRAKSEPLPRSAPADREPDKVEIHIGRIEVTAVPQEAPRPAATRPRKSLDLGDYLKRRDGRTG